MADVTQVEYLRLCPKLRQLTLAGDPVSRAATVCGTFAGAKGTRWPVAWLTRPALSLAVQGTDAYRDDIFTRVPQCVLPYLSALFLCSFSPLLLFKGKLPPVPSPLPSSLAAGSPSWTICRWGRPGTPPQQTQRAGTLSRGYAPHAAAVVKATGRHRCAAPT